MSTRRTGGHFGPQYRKCERSRYTNSKPANRPLQCEVIPAIWPLQDQIKQVLNDHQPRAVAEAVEQVVHFQLLWAVLHCVFGDELCSLLVGRHVRIWIDAYTLENWPGIHTAVE